MATNPACDFSTEDITRLRDCLNDLVSIMAMPALSTGGEPGHIVSTLLDALLATFRPEFVFARLNDPEGGPGIEMMRAAESLGGASGADLSLASARLGLHGEFGNVVAGSQKLDFPAGTERLLLDVAASQATIGLQQARLFNRRRSEEALREGERESRLIVDSIPGLVAVFTPGGEVEFVNRPILEYFGRTLEELRRWGTGSTTHPEDLPRVVELFSRSIASGDPFDFEVRARRFDGVYRWFRSRGFPLRDSSGQIVRWYNLLIDIDERKRAEQALNRTGAELAHVSRVTTLSALTASIAHEVNQPLSGIITNAGTCLRMLAAEPPDIDGARETARRTIRDGNRASDVISRLRALFSKREFPLEPLDLTEATREVIALSSNDLQRHRIVLQQELADDLPLVTGDRIQLQQVILNLLRNASDAMADVHDRPRQLLIKTQREDGDHVRVTVRDAGTGLPPQTLDSLFDAFYTTKSGGMGIGLFVSRSIVERHQGRLWAESNDGPGASFSFSIPFSPSGMTDGARVPRTS